MQTVVNYQKEMERILAQLEGTPSLLLHSCCGPCSSAVLERLAPHFRITVDYYNPNIAPAEEYHRRADEEHRFLREAYGDAVPLREGPYVPDEFYAAVRGLEDIPEGGERCFACYLLRLRHTAQAARAGGFDFFTTTLSVSPHKNAAVLNAQGLALEKEYGVRFLPADFKKKEGFKRSLVLSEQYGLYRQDYCGCVFSKRERGL